jgi:hypothetical protein
LETAEMLVSGLEGAMLVARPFRQPARFDAARSLLLGGLIASPSAASIAKPV